jgi:cell fate regulator YaaT (PSP1 superfamily)
MSQTNTTGPANDSPPTIPPGPPNIPFTSRIVGVKFRRVGKVFDFDARDFKFVRGDKVVCDFEDKGMMLGEVSKPTISIPPEVLKLKLQPVLRPANHNDLKNRERQESQERDSLNYTKNLVENSRLPMHIVAVEIPLHGKKAIVYFSSEQRVDFRDLVKDLVHYFKMRVELRQLGARDETKFIGGIGPCGQETCCSRFLTTFHKVSTKMAKDQGLSLTPTKVSGNCGRLKCCLAYEQPVYAEARKTLPKLGNCVKCSSGGDGKGSGCGIVLKLDVLKQMVTVKFDDGAIDSVPVGRIIEQDTLAGKPSEVSKIFKDNEILGKEESDASLVGAQADDE